MNDQRVQTDYFWDDYRGRRTWEYWKWRILEHLGLPWPEEGDPDWYHSKARSYTQYRNQETGTRLYVNAEAGSMSPQLLLQVTPFCWGLAVSVGDNHLAWKVGPIAIKFHWGPMDWRKKFEKGFDTPWS